MLITNRIAKTAAVLAGLSLIISAFAVSGTAQAQSASAQANASANASFNRNLTIGSTGADVTALQNWLISKGFSIPAGATGYFGGQTQAALARYQASVGITPAAGYFGPITRAKVQPPVVITVKPTPKPTDDDNDDGDEDESDNDQDRAEAAIDDIRKALSDARDDVEEADDDNEDVGDAEEFLDDAEDLLDDAEEAFDDEDYDEAMDLADEADDLIDDARDEIGANDDEDDDDEDDISTSAKTSVLNGANNDYATFEITFELEAFGNDSFIDRDPDVSFDYEIQESDGDAVAGATTLEATLDSTAKRDNGYYVVNEDEDEEFTLTVTFDPLAADEGQAYRLQLNSIGFNDTDAPADRTWNARPESDYRTKSVFIGD